MNKKNYPTEYSSRDTRRRLILSAVLFLLTFCQLGVAFAWFVTSNTVHTSASFSVVRPDSWSFSDSAYYKFKSQPFSSTSGQFYLDSYDYVIAENNDSNNVFVVFEVEILSGNTGFQFSVLTNESQLLTKQYNPCNISGAMISVRGAPEYLINQIGYSVYYFNTTSQTYVLCEDYGQISYYDGAYLYGLSPCYYSTFFLSDCMTIEFCSPNIADIQALQNKTNAKDLTELSDLYVSLTSYFGLGNYTADTFVDTTNWSKKTKITFTGNFTADKTKTINGRRFAYIVLNLKYATAVMTNTDPNYRFERNINQLFASDFRFELV